jgi:hypothetical protein
MPRSIERSAVKASPPIAETPSRVARRMPWRSATRTERGFRARMLRRACADGTAVLSSNTQGPRVASNSA